MPARKPTITAEPNPVPAGPSNGTTRITWDTGSSAKGQVFVADNGKPEKPFGPSRATGSQDAPWINAGWYEFRLYDSADRTKLLARVKVIRSKK